MIKVNDEYGVYIVKEEMQEKAKDGHKLYRIQCSICGQEFIKPARAFSGPKAIAHVCVHNQDNFGEGYHRLHQTFRAMIARCSDSSRKDYRFYGAKGIRVCDEWVNNPLKFKEWAVNNGYQDNLTIDRIDSSKDYYPENCRWITMEENARFKSTTNYIEVNGTIASGKQWATKLGVGMNYINRYLRKYGLEATVDFIKAKLSEQEDTNNVI